MINVNSRMISQGIGEEIIEASNEFYGMPNRTVKAYEECAELIQAIAKLQLLETEQPLFPGEDFAHKKNAIIEHICDEIIDVEIVLAAFKKFLPTETLNKYRQEKLTRLAKRIGYATV